MKNNLSFRKALLTLAFVFGFVLLSAAQEPTKATGSRSKTNRKSSLLLGAWQGTFDGSASGQCELRFSRDANGNPTGQISIRPDGGEKSPYLNFESLSLEKNTVKATFTDAQGAKVQFDGTLKNDQLKGNWKTSENQEGSWLATKSGKE
jgi:hypothetical protein